MSNRMSKIIHTCIGVVLILVSVTLAAACSTQASPTSEPSLPTAANHDQVGVIGDSLTVDMEYYGYLSDQLRTLGFRDGNFRIDGQWGRGISSPEQGTSQTATPYTSDVIEKWRSTGFDPRVWVIALGTNNADDSADYWQEAIKQVADRINSGPAHDYVIYWISTGYSGPDDHRAPEFWHTLEEATSEIPHTIPCDYLAYLNKYRADPQWNSWWDGIHNTQAGYRDLRAPFYGKILEGERPR